MHRGRVDNKENLMNKTNGVRGLVCALSLLGLAACGGGEPRASIGGILAGLNAGGRLVLQENEADNLTLTQNGPFTFTSTVAAQSAYNVQVLTQPTGQICAIAAGSGSVDLEGDAITSVAVDCILSASIGGTVSGLPAGTSVTLSDGALQLPIAVNGTFAFPGVLPTGSSYDVTITTQPAGHVCTVQNPTGTIAADAISSVIVTCA
jgi:hypothetical protein